MTGILGGGVKSDLIIHDSHLWNTKKIIFYNINFWWSWTCSFWWRVIKFVQFLNIFSPCFSQRLNQKQRNIVLSKTPNHVTLLPLARPPLKLVALWPYAPRKRIQMNPIKWSSPLKDAQRKWRGPTRRPIKWKWWKIQWILNAHLNLNLFQTTKCPSFIFFSGIKG